MIHREVGVRPRDGQGGDAIVRRPHITVDFRTRQDVPLDEWEEGLGFLVGNINEERFIRRYVVAAEDPSRRDIPSSISLGLAYHSFINLDGVSHASYWPCVPRQPNRAHFSKIIVPIDHYPFR